jgi:hypothetical protein
MYAGSQITDAPHQVTVPLVAHYPPAILRSTGRKTLSQVAAHFGMTHQSWTYIHGSISRDTRSPAGIM